MNADYSGVKENDGKPEFTFQSLIYIMVTAPALMNTVMVVLLVILFGPLSEPHMVVAKGALLCIGLSALFANLGRSMMYAEAMEALGKSDKQYYGKYMVFLVLPEIVVIHGLLFAVLGLALSGIIGEPAALSMEAADIYFRAGIIMGVSALAALFMGYTFRRAPSLLESTDNYVPKLLRTVAPVGLNVIGLVMAIWLMMDSGFIA